MSIQRISVFGIGYVGAVSAACYANSGLAITAFDINESRLNAIREGRSPIIEPQLEKLIRWAVASGTLTTKRSVLKAIRGSDLSLVCVGTPSRPNGSLDTSYIEQVSKQIGKSLAKDSERGAGYHSVVIRSSILPGTMTGLVIPILEEHAGGKAGVDFGVGYFPEFLREGTAIEDFNHPGAIVFGAIDEITLERLKVLNQHLPCEPKILDITAAEAVKYANNFWHAVKIGYANEIGNICSSCGIDSHEVMDVVCSDKKLNISSAYMRPGFAFGGSCLPKDLRALRHIGEDKNLPTPIVEAVLSSNRYQVEKALNLISDAGHARIGLVGLTFKPDTDDLRESPMVDLAERLCKRGYRIKIYDPNVTRANGRAANGGDFTSKVPHLSRFLVKKFEELMSGSETIVVGVNSSSKDDIWGALEGSEKHIIDLVRVKKHLRTGGRYTGICW